MQEKNKKQMDPKKRSKLFKGTVISDKMMKTVVVKITRLVKHKLYKKRIKVSSKIFVHDKENECSIGDKISIRMCRPISKNKAFTFVNKIKEN